MKPFYPVLLSSLVAVASLTFAHTAAAQERPRPFEFGGYGGYLFGSSVEGKSQPVPGQGVGLTSHASLEAAPSYGGFLDVRVRKDAMAEVSYSRQETDLSLGLSDGSKYHHQVILQYLQVGGLIEFHSRNLAWLRPLFGLTLGATLISAHEQDVHYNEGAFSMVAEGGAKIRVTDFLGLRLRARAFATFLPDESALFCVNNSCAFAYSGTALLQGELGLGAYAAF